MTRRFQYPSVSSPTFVEAAAEDITLDKWYALPEQPLNQVQYPANYSPMTGFSLDAEFIFLNFSLGPDQILSIKYPVPEGIFLPDYARLLDEEFTFVTWWRQTEEPVRVLPHLLDNGSIEFHPFPIEAPVEEVTLDKWVPIYPTRHNLPIKVVSY